ncbi:hypothetical protein F7725_002649 [Dissostichus mawsoni]|uniref:Uncharacterized protein n=1 Tax=Dissostichus mawsoni TaxID=36200 RepID=A0A7J5Y365_DISMA|nr:hypothetical protein F7725_002649 [Dissostichus mawsoni]
MGLEASPVQSYSPTQSTTVPFESPDKPSGEFSPLGSRFPQEEVGKDAEMSRSRQEYAMTADKSISKRFQSDVKEERAMREETGTNRESSDRRQQKDFAGVKREEVSRESIRSKQGGEISEESIELGAIKKDERRVQDEADLKEFNRMKERKQVPEDPVQYL